MPEAGYSALKPADFRRISGFHQRYPLRCQDFWPDDRYSLGAVLVMLTAAAATLQTKTSPALVIAAETAAGMVGLVQVKERVMTRKIAAISKFRAMLARLRSASPYSAEWVAAESNVQECRWELSNIGLTEAEIADLARG